MKLINSEDELPTQFRLDEAVTYVDVVLLNAPEIRSFSIQDILQSQNDNTPCEAIPFSVFRQMESLLLKFKYVQFMEGYNKGFELTELGRNAKAAGGHQNYLASFVETKKLEEHYKRKVLQNLEATTAAAKKAVEQADETLRTAQASAKQAKNSANIALISAAVTLLDLIVIWLIAKA